MKNNYNPSRTLMRWLVCLILTGLGYTSTFAQTISSYSFAQSNTTYKQLGEGASLTTTGFYDDSNFSLVNLPFTFTYHSTAFTTIGISANGFAKLGGITTTTYSNVFGNYTEILAPFSADLYGNTANGGGVLYATTGTAPNRVFTVQWTNWGFYSSAGNEMSFQLKLFETANTVQFMYSPSFPASHSVWVGMSGATTADLQSRTTTTNWAATTAGVSNSSCTLSSTIYPLSGQTYQWTSSSTVAGMPFSQFSSIYVPVEPAVLATNFTPSASLYDDANFGTSAIPFTFSYHGAPYSTISVGPNGYTQLSTVSSTLGYSALCGNANVISPFNGDLYGNTSSPIRANASTFTVGTAPNRQYVVQWSNWGFYSGALNEISFQVRLFETTNVIQFVYGPQPGSGSRTVYVGLTGNSTADYLTRSITSNWSASTAGTSNCVASTYNSSVRPPNGLVYTFSPPLSTPCSGTPAPGATVSNASSTCVGSTVNLSLSNAFVGITGLTYVWQSAPDVAGAPGTWGSAGGTLSTFSPTVTAKTWYRCQVSCGSNSALSTPVSVGLSTCVGTGTSLTPYLPIYTCYGYNYSQQIYTASEIISGGGNPGTISKIRFFYNDGGTPASTWPQWKIYMGNTTLDYFASTSSWIPLSSLVQVYDNSIPTPVNGTWMELTLATPFTYTGGNLVIAVDENTPSYSCTANWGGFTSSSLAGPKALLYYSDVTNPDPAVPPGANYSNYTDRARIQLEISPPPPCAGTPTPGNTITSTTSACAGVTFTLSLQTPTVGSGLIYQWQAAPDVAGAPGSWANVGPNASIYPATATAKTWYRCTVTCGSNSGTSNPVAVNVSICVGIGTGTNPYLPIYSFYGYNYSQQIYLASEISAGGGAMGTITKIRFYLDNGGLPETTWKDWKLYLGNTSLNNLSSTTGWVPVNTLTQVFDGQIPTPVPGQWMELTLATPFFYTGGNLVLAVDENTPAYSGTAYWGSFTASAASGPRGMLYYSDVTNPDPSAPPTANYSTTTDRARLQLAITPPPPCLGPFAVSVGSLTPTSASVSFTCPFCTGNYIVEYGAPGFTPGTGASAGGGTVVTGGSSPIALTGLTSNTTYQVYVRQNCTGSGNGYSENSTMVSFSTPCVPVPVVITPASATICQGASVNLTATGGNGINYAWSPAGSLNTNTGSTVSASPSTTTTYTVVSSAGGTLTYNENFVLNATPVSQAISWCNYRTTLLASYAYTTLTIKGSQNPTGITLSDPTAVAAIANAMRTGTNYSVTVAGNTWYVGTGCLAGVSPCSGSAGVSLTVNTTACNCDVASASIYVVRPEINNANWGGINTITCGAPSQSMIVEFGYGSGGGSCPSTQTVTVDVTPAPSVVATATPANICSGGSSQLNAVQTSSITYHIGLSQLLNVPNDCGNGPYTACNTTNAAFTWMDTGVGSVSNIQIQFGQGVECHGVGTTHTTSMNATAGPTYQNTVSNCGCSYATPPIITLNLGPGGYVVGGANTFSIGGNTTCLGFQNLGALGADYATVTVTYATGGTPTYAWSNTSYLNNSTIANPIASGITTSQTFTVVATANGCPGPPSSVTVSANPATVSVSPSATGTICIGVPVTLTANAAAGVAPYSYLWSNGSTSSAITVTPSTSTTYTVTVTDGCGSISTSSFVDIVNPILTSTTAGTRCGAGTVNLSATASSGVTIKWYDALTGGSNVGTGPSFTTPLITTTTDYYAAASGGGGGPASLSTPFNANNGQSGNMFDVQIQNAITVTSMSCNILAGTYTVQIYYKTGSHVGFETNSGAWTLLGTANGVVSTGAGVTPIPLTLNLPLSAGSGYSFYVTLVGSTNIQYTNGIAVGNTWASNADMTIKEGVGISNPLGSVFSPRNWNGVINYTAGCEGSRELVTATVTPAPPISVSSAQSIVCIGTGTTVSASSGNPNYNYTWTSTPAGFNAAGPGPHTVVATGSGTAYHVYALDPGTQCGAYETVEITTTPNNLIVSVEATPNIICAGESASFTSAPNEGGAAEYCQPQSSSGCTDNDYISSVQFASINNVTGGCNDPSNSYGGLSYYSSPAPTIAAGSNQSLVVGTSTAWGQGIAVWIDWNQNNAYESGELVLNGYTGFSGAVYSTTVSVPVTAINGFTRMRVRCQYGNDPSISGAGPCDLTGYGEVEDYAIVITGGVAPSTSGYSYSWSPSTYLSSATVANPTASNVATPISYTLTVISNATGCTVTENVPLTVNPLPEPTAFNGGPYCENQVASFFGFGGLYYTWTGPNGFLSYDQNPSSNPLGVLDGGFYTLTVEDANGCTASYDDYLTVNPNPVVDYVTEGDENCLGAGDGSIEIGLSSGDGSFTTTDNSLLTSFDNPAAFSALSPGTYYFNITDGNNCSTTASATIGTVPNLPPVLTCPANVSISNALGVCGSPYNYTVLAEDACPGIGSVIQTAGLNNIATFPVGTTTNSFIVYDVLGASHTCSFNITVTDTESPTIANVPASFASCNPVTWTPPTITDNCPGVIIQPSHVPGTVFGSGTTTVTYTATDAYNQVTTQSFDVTVLEPSVAASSIASSRDFNNICAGENITLSVVGGLLGDGASWKWYTGSCSGTLIGTGPSIVVTPAVTTTYYVRAEGTCGPSACTSLQVVVTTSAPLGGVTITTFPAYGAPGITDVISVNPVVGATYYQWSTNNGQIGGVLFNNLTSPVQTSVPTVNITFVQPQSNYQIRVLAGNACGRTGQTNAHIRGTVSAPTSLTGPTQVCPNQTASYTVSAVSGNNVSYQWVLIPASAGTISGTGLTRTVTFASGFTSAQLCVNGVSSFGLPGAPLCITISTNAPVPGAITGNASPCSGSTSVYSITPVPAATSYIWTVLGNVVSGANSASASLTFPAGTFSGTVCVQSVSACGTSTPSCMSVTSGTPGNPGPISGPSQGICGASNVNYSLGTSGATYNWILPAGVTPTGPTNLNSINVTFSGTFAGGNIVVEAQYACGSPVPSSLAVSGEPTTPVVNPATICANSTELYFATSTGATGYNWTFNSAVDAFCTNPPLCNQYYAEWGPGGGSFSVVATNGCGTSAPFNLSTNCRIAENGTYETKVYPNPNTGQFVVELNSYAGGNHNLTITDLSGRVILVKDVKATSGMNQYEMDLGFANAGLYMLYVKDAQGMISVTKIVVE